MLPKEIQELDEVGRNVWIETKKQERETIQKDIQGLNAQREKFIGTKTAEMDGENELGKAVQKSVRAQAEEKGYKFKK